MMATIGGFLSLREQEDSQTDYFVKVLSETLSVIMKCDHGVSGVISEMTKQQKVAHFAGYEYGNQK